MWFKTSHILIFFLLLYKVAKVRTVLTEHLELDNLRFNQCGRYTCSETGKFQFNSDVMYEYHYTLSIKSTYDEKAAENSEVKLDFKVEVRIESCDGVLRVARKKEKEGFSVFDVDGHDKIYEDVNRHLLRFSFYDGSIMNVCPNEEESTLSLNIKKGILSAFQNKMKRFDIDKLVTERDVNGLCPTHYNLQRINGTTLTIRKLKNISNCLERCQLHSIIPTSKFIFQSISQMDSTQFERCMSPNDRAQCSYLHPMPRRTHAENFTESDLQFPDIYKSAISPQVSLREDLSFDHKKPKKSEISELEESEALLLQLCKITSEEFQLDAADIFAKFIHSARHLSYDALDTLLDRGTQICSTGRKHVQDSLPFLRSTASLTLMKGIINNGEISESTANGWLFAMSLFSRPDLDVIKSVTPMLYGDNASNNVLLSVSSVLHSYNMWTGEHEDKKAALSDITYLETTLNETLIRREDPDKIIVLLKAIGNAGIQTETIGFTLSSCIRNSAVSVDVKIAAIEAHRRLPCDFNLESLLDIYTNYALDSEVRISAYLQVMKCPSYGTVKKVKMTLQSESLNQVGSFVWSHLQNVLKSTLEYRIHLQALLQDYNLQQKFKTDFRKYSRNYESSFYLTDYGVGGVMIANVIFSTKTYIPKYLTLNFTVEVFGEIINVMEINMFVEGLEKYAEGVFKEGTDYLTNKLDKLVSPYRFLRSIPMSINEKISYMWNNLFGNYAEPTLTVGIRLFGNEIHYSACRGQKGVTELIEKMDFNNMIREFFKGQGIKYDYSTVFMDMSYVCPTGAGAPLNLDLVGIAITNFDTSVFVNFTDFSANDTVFIDSKLKPRFSLNFEGNMGTDLVYEQTQVQVRNKIYTSSELEAKFHMKTVDDILLSIELPQNKFDIFSFQSDLYYKNNIQRKDIMLQDTSLVSQQPSCFWPLLEQTLGLKVCSTYYTADPEALLQSLMHIIRGPFKFSLYVEKSDPSAKVYLFKYRKHEIKINESFTTIEFETPGSIIPRSMNASIFTSLENNNVTVIVHANKTILQARGFYKYTLADKVLNFDVNINGLRHVDLILELHMNQDKRATYYLPKLYLAISSKPVVELTGTYSWVEKKGISLCDVDLQFKTNKFDSNIKGSVELSDGSIRSNMHINYKFEKSKYESLNFEIKLKKLSSKLKNVMSSDVLVESTSYPEINLNLTITYEQSHNQFHARFNYEASPFEVDENKKLTVQGAVFQQKSFKGFKFSTFLEIKKPVNDVNIKISFDYNSHPNSSCTKALIRYAKDKDIVVTLTTDSPQTAFFHYGIKLNTTIPSVHQPMVVTLRIIEKKEAEYDVDFEGTWFSGHTAMAKGFVHDKSTAFAKNYIMKLEVRSRLFNEISVSIKINFNALDNTVIMSADHDRIKYALMLRHSSINSDKHETYIEYIYNNSQTYSLNNNLDIIRKEVFLEVHLDRYRDIQLLLKGRLKRWDSNVGVDLKWDVNRDPSQNIVINFHTQSIEREADNDYRAIFLFEYPGHVSEAGFYASERGNYKSVTVSLEMNPTSIIELMAYSENELFSQGYVHLGFKLLTPFEKWKETAFFYGLNLQNQNFRTNGNLTWQGDQNIILDTSGGYAFKENVTCVTFSSFLNSTLQDLSALAFLVNYTSIEDQVYLSVLLQPNIKYSLYITSYGMIKHDAVATEYVLHLTTKMPFLEYSDNELGATLKLMSQNRIVGNLLLRLNENVYTLSTRGALNLFESSKLCFVATTPFEKYRDMNGLLFYSFDEKLVYLNLTGSRFNAMLNLKYFYRNVSNFNCRLEMKTPISYLSQLALIALRNSTRLEIRTSWNTFNLGFNGVSHFASWKDLEYRVHLFTPIESFKQSEVTFKVFVKPQHKVITARVILSNMTKVGINIVYNSEKNKIIYQNDCDNIFAIDDAKIPRKVVITNGLLELDTLIYPTITGMFTLDQSGNRYTFDSKLVVFFLKMNLWNQIDYESNESLNNTFYLTSSIDLFSSILTHVMLSKLDESVSHLYIDLEVVKFTQKLKGNVDVMYEYKTVDAKLKQIKNRIDGIHNIAIKLNTPFEMMEQGEIIIETQIENNVFETEVKTVTKYTNISIIGDLQFLENYFDLNLAFDMSSVHLSVPSFRLQILRDFSKSEKRVALVLKEPTNAPLNDKFRDFFSIRSSWYMDNRNHISLSGEIISPLKILDEMKASLLYSHENNNETYYLEAYMKYSNKTEMKARAELKPPNVTLNLESSMEGLKNAHFIGTLEKTAPGQQKIDAVMLTNSNFRIQGSSSSTNLVPFAIRGKLFRGKDGIEVSSVEMAVKKKSEGYDIIASLYSKGKSLVVETEITDFPDDVRVIKLTIKTGRGDLEYLNVNAEMKLQHPGIYILTVKGDSAMNEVRGNSISVIEIWFRNGVGALFASLDSATMKGKGDLFIAWKPPNFVYGSSKINFVFDRKETEVFNSKLYFIREDQSLHNFSTGITVNLNKKWVMESNATVMIKAANDTQIATHLVLPNKNTYSVMGFVKYDESYDIIQHVIVISRPQDTPCYTLSDVNFVGVEVGGIFAFKCGIKDKLFMMDNFKGTRTSKELILRNWLKSNTLNHALVTNVNYNKRSDDVHVLNLKFLYPPIKEIALINVHFESTSNFDAFVNSTTPYRNLPYFACEVNSVTKTNFYQRCGKVYLNAKPAFVNITKIQTATPSGILNDGEITLNFPVTTWHEGTLFFTYLNTSVHINGTMRLFYNKDRFINGTFTRNSTNVGTFDRAHTHMEVGNMFMPVGINYIHETDIHELNISSHDFKRVELYKLKNSSSFNMTGEVILNSLGTNEWTTIKIINFNRSVVVKSSTDGGNGFETGIFVRLKPEFWCDYDLKTSKLQTETTYEKVYDLSLAYPRRNYSLISTLGYGENYLTSQFELNNFLTNPKKTIFFHFEITKPSNNLREINALLYHPSFKKNVTINVSFSTTKTTLADLKLLVDYSLNRKRKLEFSGIVLDKSEQGKRFYTFFFNGNHENTRFKLDMTGILKSESGDHSIGNNISYIRSYLPEQFWNGKAILNTKKNVVTVERISTRAMILLHGDYNVTGSKHVLNTKIIEGTDTHISGNFRLDVREKDTYSIVNLTEDASDRLQIEGNIPENREAKFNVWRTYNDFHFPQVSFCAALNHSRFLSSAFLWRTDVGTNILKTVRNTISYLWASGQESVEFWTQFLRSEATETLSAIWNDAKLEIHEFLDDMNNIKSIQENINYFKKLFNDSYNANEFFLKDIHGLYNLMSHDMTFINSVESLPKIFGEIVQSMGDTSQVVRKSLVWLVNTIRELYEQLLHILDQLVEGKAEEYIGTFIRKGTDRFDNFVKDLHISFVSTMETAVNEMMSVLSHYQKKILVIFEPTFIEIVHHIDSTFWASSKELIDFLYARKAELMNSPLLLKSANLSQRLDAIYKDLVKNDLMTNVKKYLGILSDVIYDYYISQIPYKEELTSIGKEILDEIKELHKLPLIAYTIDNIKIMYKQVIWLYDYFEVSQKFQKLIPFLYRQFRGNSYTAIEAQLKNQKPKTKFLFMPENGIIIMEQKLPFPWHAFNETPIYEELEEYKFFKKIQSWLSGSQVQIWSMFRTARTLLKPQTWFPPFKAHAQLIGYNNYISFDIKHIPFYGNSCQYLLSHDFVNGAFSLVLNSDEKDLNNQPSISLLFDEETINIQLDPVRIEVQSQRVSRLPLQLNNTYIYFDHGIICVDSKLGITLNCNVYYHICSVHLSGWFFGKVSGLLGTMNNEPSDDIFKSKTRNEHYLWSITPEKETCPVASNISMVNPIDGVHEKCSELFVNYTSPFQHCFNEVDPSPYFEICISEISDEKVCSAAMAYIQSCSLNSVPLRIPSFCVNCSLMGQKNRIEGTIITLSGKQVPKSSDFVFIVEAKNCNKDMVTKKNIQLLINAINESCNNTNSPNRYSLVVFGGEGIYEKPHSVVLNGVTSETNGSKFGNYFENLPTGNGSSDIFDALRFASKLQFRLGVAKIFILILCSNCDPANMELDFSVLYQAMIEKSIKLHILMDDNFPAEKVKSKKNIFGIDTNNVYTKGGSKELKGDKELSSQVTLTQSLLGLCTPLALGSGGSLFTAKPLSDSQLSKKFRSVFAKRIALTANPDKCQNCECQSDDNGVPYLDCTSCLVPVPSHFEFSIDDETDFGPTMINSE